MGGVGSDCGDVYWREDYAVNLSNLENLAKRLVDGGKVLVRHSDGVWTSVSREEYLRDKQLDNAPKDGDGREPDKDVF
jgi:hypothetical protein